MSSFGRAACRGVWAGVFAIAFSMIGCGAPDGSAEPTAKPPSPQEDPLTMGTRLHETVGCATCHSLDGRKRTAGTYKGIYGTPVELADGTIVVRDEDYLRRSILQSDAEIVKGYTDVMPDYAETLTPVEVDALIALIQSVGPAGDSERSEAQ